MPNTTHDRSGAPRAASIDIGTNSVLLLVAESVDTTLRSLREEARITRLGKGAGVSGRLSEEAMLTTLHVIEEYAGICRGLGAGEIRAVGTAAMRNAANAALFVDRVRQATGVGIEIISDEREAWLSYLGSASSFGRNIIVLDIGGGSTEIISPRSRGIDAVSIGIGVVALKEEFQRHDPPTDAEIALMTEHIRKKLVPSLEAHRPIVTGSLFVAAAGTATTLAAMHRAVEYKPELVHGSRLALADVDALIERIRTLPSSDIRHLAGVQAGREDVILAGAIIMREVMSHLGCMSATISDRGVRWGVLVEALNIEL